MGAVGERALALIGGLRDTPWPDAERLVAWANEAGDDPAAAWASCGRVDDLLGLAASFGVSPARALVLAATELREALRLAKVREPRIARIAFAAEQGGGKNAAARGKLLDDAKTLLADAERTGASIAKAADPSREMTRRSAMEIERAAAFLALALVSAELGTSCHANLAHAFRQIAGAHAAIGSSEDSANELGRLASALREALGTEFARGVSRPA
jgi:hypothetical protein